MTNAANQTLESLYQLVKQHEKCLSQVAHSTHLVERDIFGELLADTRVLSHELSGSLDARGLDVETITIPVFQNRITPPVLIEQRRRIRKAYSAAIAALPAHSPVRTSLENQFSRLDGGAQEKLDILCAAIVSDQ